VWLYGHCEALHGIGVTPVRTLAKHWQYNTGAPLFYVRQPAIVTGGMNTGITPARTPACHRYLSGKLATVTTIFV
jgi:hypothetical protein